MGHGVSFDRIADQYDQTRGGMPRARAQAEVLDAFLPPTGPLLEIGVGTGLIAAALAERGRSVVGVDLSAAMLARARERIPGRLVRASALRLPVSTGAVAGCYLFHVLHLVSDIRQTLAEVRRVLTPGGTMVVSVSPPPEPPGHDVDEVLRELRHEVGAGGRDVDQEATILGHTGQLGFTVAGRAEVTLGYGTRSPELAAERIRARTWSWMWDHDEQVWQPAARRALARLAALPDQATPRSTASAQQVIAFRRD